ncbi:MAG: hypothetical protein HYR63_24675 [Proteobacteria bacterium]|nr:hypothetical protein [Pseudomonadota bacterium]
MRARLVGEPALGAALAGLGVAFVQSGDAQAGAGWLQRAALASGDGLIAEAAAAALLQVGDFRSFARWLRRLLAFEPSHSSRLAALGRAEAALGADALWPARIRGALASSGPATGILRIAAALFRHAGRLATALAAARAAVAFDPADIDAVTELALVLHALGHGDLAELFLARALSREQRGETANLLVVIRSYSASLEALFTAVQRHAAITSRSATARPTPPGSADAGRPLRIGYVSADFRDHPVGHTLIGLFGRHSRSDFDIVCYSGVAQADLVTERFRALASAFRPVMGLSDERLATLIRDDRIDVLVHVAGHFSGNRPDLAVHRAAPVQVSLYDLTSTGHAAIQAWVADPDLHPAGSRECFLEPVVNLPVLYLFTQAAAIDPGPVPARRNGFVTFGSANSPSKWSPDALSSWAEILRRTPRSRLWLKFHVRTADPATRRLLSERLAAHGIPPDRVDFDDGGTSKDAHLRALAKLDIALDPHPFAGATSSFEALWMGIPIITLAGDRVMGRAGVSLLRRLALPDLIADCQAAYVETACRLAADLERLDRLRLDLRDRLLASPFLDAATYAQSLERLYLELWREACERHHSRHISR